MGCPKCFREVQISIAPGHRPPISPMLYKQVFQNRKFPVEVDNEPLQYWNRFHETDAEHTITLLQCIDQPLFIFRVDVIIFVKVIDDEGKV